MIPLLLFLVVSCSAWDSPAPKKNEAVMTPIQLIRHRGYPAHEHRVITKDGYVLILHRIPGDRHGCHGGRPVLLQHGLLLSSFDWLSPKRNQSLSYALADAGYDVWIANSRGNLYSNKHKKYNTSDPRFWNFSLDEMGSFDYSAIIDYINWKTRRALFVVGHSQGALTFLIANTRDRSIARKVRHFFGLAPAIGTQSAAANLLKIVMSLPPEFLATFPLTSPTSPVFFPFCSNATLTPLCLGLLAATGPLTQLEPARLPLFLSHFPAGTSVKLVLHLLQQAAFNRTRAFDYGEIANPGEYGTATPPAYDFSRYRVPTTLYFSPADTLVDNDSIKQALAVVPRRALVNARNLTGFGHFDFLWGTRASKEIYRDIFTVMKRFGGK